MVKIRAKDMRDLMLVRDGLNHSIQVLKSRGETELVGRLEYMLKIVDSIIEYAERSHAKEKAKRRKKMFRVGVTRLSASRPQHRTLL
jgi:hypothetical protein